MNLGKQKILFLDATIRENSRTRELAKHLVSKLDGEVLHLALHDKDIKSLNKKMLEDRTKFCETLDFSSNYFDNAKQFANADCIVIAAPYWDYSFPAVLKKYVESITVNGLTFEYTEDGTCNGLCKAKKLFYVTTAGGKIFNDSFGYGYIRELALNMFGIKQTQMFKAENLDIVGADVKLILTQAKETIDHYNFE